MVVNDIEDRITSALGGYRFDEQLFLSAEPAPNRSPRRSRRRWPLLAGAAAGVVLFLVLFGILPLGLPGEPSPAVAALLHGFARIAQNALPEPAPQTGQFVYTKTMARESYVHVSGNGRYRFVYSIPETTQQWLGVDGSGLQVRTLGDHPTFPTEADRAMYRAFVESGSEEADEFASEFGKTSRDHYGPGELFWRDTSSLATDPSRLGELIDARRMVAGPDGDWESFALATDLIRDTYARPELRAALYEYMAGLSGIELLGATTDASGRAGVALASTHDGIRHEVVFDRSNGRILEESDVVLQPEQGIFENPGPGEFAYAYAGQPMYVSTYLSFGEVVDSVGVVPR
jgi:hypothetical protein